MGKSPNKSALNAPDDDTSHQLLPNAHDAVHHYDPHTEHLISKQTSSALLTLFYYSILMFTLPFAAFFGARHFLFEHTDWTEFAVTSCAVFASVITIYVIIGLYAWHAYREQDVVLPGEGGEAAAAAAADDAKKEK